jgi:hypothetical protein
MMAGAAVALIGTAACTTLQASGGYDDGGLPTQSSQPDDVLQHMAADSQGA